MFGAVSQVIATATMLAAMRTRSFVVAVAYTKTEAAQIALFGLIALNDPPTVALITPIALATIGVALMTVQSRKDLAGDLAVGCSGPRLRDLLRLCGNRLPLAVISVDCPSRVLSASLILVVGLTIQTAALALYLGVYDRAGARAILMAWRLRCLPGSWGRWPRNSGSSPSR